MAQAELRNEHRGIPTTSHPPAMSRRTPSEISALVRYDGLFADPHRSVAEIGLAQRR